MQIGSGKGVLGQLALETGLPQTYIEIGLAAGIAYNLFSVRSWIFTVHCLQLSAPRCIIEVCLGTAFAGIHVA